MYRNRRNPPKSSRGKQQFRNTLLTVAIYAAIDPQIRMFLESLDGPFDVRNEIWQKIVHFVNRQQAGANPYNDQPFVASLEERSDTMFATLNKFAIDPFIKEQGKTYTHAFLHFTRDVEQVDRFFWMTYFKYLPIELLLGFVEKPLTLDFWKELRENFGEEGVQNFLETFYLSDQFIKHKLVSKNKLQKSLVFTEDLAHYINDNVQELYHQGAFDQLQEIDIFIIPIFDIGVCVRLSSDDDDDDWV